MTAEGKEDLIVYFYSDFYPLGIPVYQQQLVWGETELQDEFCLEEYCITTGAQLKLMVAMRGGPIHAQRGKLWSHRVNTVDGCNR